MKRLLNLYPQQWRARYEEEYLALLEERHSSLFDMIDVVLGAIDAHLQPQVAGEGTKSEGRLQVNMPTFIRWSGLASMLGSVLLFVSLIGASVFSDKDYPYTYGFEDIAFTLLIGLSPLLLLVGYLGFYLRQSAVTGKLGLEHLGIAVSSMGLVVFFLGALGSIKEAVSGYEVSGSWDLGVRGFLFVLIGLLLFATVGLRKNTLPRGGAITCIVGCIGILASVVLSMGLVELPPFTETAIPVAMLTSFGLVTAGWVWLGYALWMGIGITPAQAETSPS